MERETERYEYAILMTCGCLAAIEQFRDFFTKGYPAGNRKKADDSAVMLIMWYETFLTYFKGESRSDQNTLGAPVEVINERLNWAVTRYIDYLNNQPVRDDFFCTTYRIITGVNQLTCSEASDLICKQGDLYLDQISSQIKDDWLRERFSDGLPLIQSFYSELKIYTM